MVDYDLTRSFLKNYDVVIKQNVYTLFSYSQGNEK